MQDQDIVPATTGVLIIVEHDLKTGDLAVRINLCAASSSSSTLNLTSAAWPDSSSCAMS